MGICLSHSTAQEFWLRAAMREPEADLRAFESCTGNVAACRDELARAVPTLEQRQHESHWSTTCFPSQTARKTTA